MRTHVSLALFAIALLLACRSTPVDGASAPETAQHATASAHDKSFWHAIVANGYAVPAGCDAAELALELAHTTSSTDAELRDELGFEISARWIRRPGILSDESAHALFAFHRANLCAGLGEGESDGVYKRSFSALHLSRLVARDLQRPFLSSAERATLVQDSCRVLREERDRRGWVEGHGWAHPIAHNADLLSFLAREPELTADGQREMLRALDAGLAGANAFGENERLAAVLQALVARVDFADAELARWLAPWAEASRAVWTKQPFDVAAFHKSENVQSLLRSVLLAILLDEHATASEQRAAAAIRQAFFPAQG